MEKIKTISDLAQVLGISPSTVSRVLNKRGYYSKEVEEKVMALVEESGFVYNMAAKGLRSACTHTVGLMVPDISNSFFSQMALAIETRLRQVGYSLFICNSLSQPDTECALLSNFAANRVDGILCASLLLKMPPHFDQYGIPLVALDRHPLGTQAIPRVVSDEEALGRMAAQTLLEGGAVRPLVLQRQLPGPLPAHHKAFGRHAGFVDYCREAGLSLSPRQILTLSGEGNPLEEAQALVAAVVDSGQPFDSIFAASDLLAAGALGALESRGIQVPGQVQVLGVDNSPLAALIPPGISSIDRDLPQMAHTACQILLDLMGGDQSPALETCIPARVVKRGTTR